MTEIQSFENRNVKEPSEANRAPEKSPADVADEIGRHLYQSMVDLNPESYQKNMTDMELWVKGHNPQQVSQFEERFSKNLDYKTAAMFETYVNFHSIDKNGDLRADEAEIKAFVSRPEATSFQKAAIKAEILDKYSAVANLSSDRWTNFLGQKDDQIRSIDLAKGLNDAGKKLMARQEAAPLSHHEPEQNLSPRFGAGFSDAVNQLPEMQIEEPPLKPLMDAAKQFGVNALKNSNFEFTRKQTLDEKIAQAVPNGAILEKATVQDGEGPWQSAERILSAQGDRTREDEVRALAKALKFVHTLPNGHFEPLVTGQQLVTIENYRDLLRAVKNEKVQAVLLSYAD